MLVSEKRDIYIYMSGSGGCIVDRHIFSPDGYSACISNLNLSKVRYLGKVGLRPASLG